MLVVDESASSPPSPSDPPRCDRPTRQISDFSPNSPDHALPFTAIRASERFQGRVALPALSGPLPPNRLPKGESAKGPPRRPTQASWPTPPVNEKARLDFEAGLELGVFLAG